MRASFRSWGTIPKKPQSVKSAYWASDLANLFPTDTKALPVGNGRSYGDSCLLATGSVIQMTGLNRLISFDTDAGVLKAEAGIRLCDLLQVVVPLGWFLPVTPGTAYITLGGAVANDVHGKNHHCDGPFGRYIQSLELLTSDQTLHQCSPTANTELFAATVGGLGLTGIITTIELQLIPITTSWLDVRYDSFASVEEFAQLSSSMKDTHRYTVAWMDCATKGTVGRGVLMSANHSEQGDLSVGSTTPRITVPFACPKKLLNKHTIKTFNALYFQLQNRKTQQHQHEHYQPYFYPLDAIGHWNRIYGKNGFHQYQFVVPLNQLSALSEILNVVINSGMGSFLAVLKEFGDVTSPGLLSFPRPGYCLALDFAERGEKTEKLIHTLNNLVLDADGAAYPAKDKLMSAESFQQYFPNWTNFSEFVDPACASDFWLRVSGNVSLRSTDGELT